jgi:hypothetical protein
VTATSTVGGYIGYGRKWREDRDCVAGGWYKKEEDKEILQDCEVVELKVVV